MPLTNIRVLELGTLIAGPFTGRLLGDFGAEVIKIEAPDKSDPLRYWGKSKDGVHLFWTVQSRNKKLITLNLREKKGQELFKKLVRKVDVVLENFRPGTMEKWGLGYEVLKEINPKIIMVRTSGFGQTGPYKDRAGFGSIGEAMGGLRYVTGYKDRPPTRIGVSMGDSLAALFATIGTLIALHERNSSGVGQVVDTAIYESVFAVMEALVPEYLLADYIRERTGNILPGIAPSNIYLTKDGTYIVIGANADGVFKRLCEAMGKPELAADEKYSTHHARGKNQKELDLLIEEWTKQHSSKEILDLLAEKGVPSGLIYSAKDIVEDPHYQSREMIVEVEHEILGKVPMPGIVPKLSRTPGAIRHAGRISVGYDNDEIYKGWLHLTDEEINELIKENII